MILEQLLLGIMVVAVTLLLLPFLLVMAGVGAAMLLWFPRPCWALWFSGWCFPVLMDLRYCSLCWWSVCFLSTDKPGTGLPERRETADLSLARASGWDRCN